MGDYGISGSGDYVIHILAILIYQVQKTPRGLLYLVNQNENVHIIHRSFNFQTFFQSFFQPLFKKCLIIIMNIRSL